MKRFLCMLLSLLLLWSFCACDSTNTVSIPGPEDSQGSEQTQPNAVAGSSTNTVTDPSTDAVTDPSTDKIDVDLTTLSSIMVYSQVYNMILTPKKYIGKKVKMAGTFAVYQDEKTGKNYFSCIISDATACCSKGFEFVLSGEHKYPDDYPSVSSQITVTGIFGTYEENGYTYCQLIDAMLE